MRSICTLEARNRDETRFATSATRRKQSRFVELQLREQPAAILSSINQSINQRVNLHSASWLCVSNARLTTTRACCHQSGDTPNRPRMHRLWMMAPLTSLLHWKFERSIQQTSIAIRRLFHLQLELALRWRYVQSNVLRSNSILWNILVRFFGLRSTTRNTIRHFQPTAFAVYWYKYIHLCLLQAEVRVFQVWRSPFWISYFRLRETWFILA